VAYSLGCEGPSQRGTESDQNAYLVVIHLNGNGDVDIDIIDHYGRREGLLLARLGQH